VSEPIESENTTVDFAERRRVRAQERVAGRRSRYPLYVAIGVAGLLVILAAGEALASAGRVHPRVSVAGVSVGGMSPAQAKATLQNQLLERAQKPVTVVHGDKTWEVAGTDIGLDFDFDRMVATAMAVGREGGAPQALASRLDAWLGGLEIPAIPSAEAPKLNATVDKIAEGTDDPHTDATVKLSGTSMKVVPAVSGVVLDRAQMTRLLVTAMASTERRVKAPVGEDEVDVTDTEAADAIKVAEQMISAPATVVYESETWTFSPDQIADWIAFKQVDASAPSSGAAPPSGEATGTVSLAPVISAKKATETIIPALGAGIGRPAKDAEFKTARGSVTIIPSEEGIGPDVEALALSLTNELVVPGSQRSVELRTRRTEPSLTTDDARAMGVKERISTYTTTYEASNRPRVNNIHKLGDALDGTLVKPGGTFSFNGSVGERTAAKGYTEAPAIVNGKLVPQLGGGICQVGTTIFNSVFESGLPVVQRHNHSFYISHYPKGRDATVSWGGPDFKFRNDTDSWILISVSYTNSSITISLYGTDPGYEVDAQTGAWERVRPYPTQTIKDPTMAKGSKVIEDSGQTGRSITVKRIVTKDGTEVRSDTFVSNYKPKIQVVRVGTKQVPSSKAATASPAP